MEFIDEATIEIKAGNGGRGSCSFRREKFVPFGGPDGGDGGHGGSIIVRADKNSHTLLDFHFKPKWEAGNGAPGAGRLKSGKAGSDLIIKVPVGTQIIRMPEEELVVDLDQDNQEYVIARGGRGGKGNNFFKSATNQTPEYAQPGEPGEEGEIKLSLKLVADVGLVGFPNAGKSTLISRISAAKPKIADYPFTTLVPNLGVVRVDRKETQHSKSNDGSASFVVADIPGLIPDAHQGKGLGVKFLKHIERTKVIAHLIDPNQINDQGEPIDPVDCFNIINRELGKFSEHLSQRPQVVVLTKLDTLGDRDDIAGLERRFNALGLEFFAISSISGEGLNPLISRLSLLLKPKSASNNSEALQA